MAAPPSKTLQNLSGKWQLNKSLSDDYRTVLALQGVNTLLRGVIGSASVHLTIKQPSRDQIHMEQTATAAKIPGTTEDYTLDWQWRASKDDFFGDIEGRSRWITAAEARKDNNNNNNEGGGGGNSGGQEGDGGWIDGDSEGKLIEAQGKKPDGAWEAHHFWGFEIVDGERRHTRRVTTKNDKGEEVTVRMVYDFIEE